MAHDWLTHNPVDGITRQECQKCGAFRWIDAAPVLETECTPKVDLIRSYGPGKFSTILDSYVYQVSLEGGCDDEIADADASAWFGMMRNGHTIFRDHHPLLETLNEAEREKLTSCAGVILSEDGDGFVAVSYYDTEDELNAAWERITARFDEETEDDEEGA